MGLDASASTPGRLRSFDPVRVADLEFRAWVGYYLRDWPGVLRASIGLVHAGFRMDWLRTLHGAWLVLRANQLWAPADNDPDGARRCMRRFYGLVKISYGEPGTWPRPPAWKWTGGGSTVSASTQGSQTRGSPPTATRRTSWWRR